MALQNETVAALLRGVDWFRSLTEEDLERLSERALTVRLEADETIFEEGDQGDRMFVIQSGAVRVVRRLEDGRALTLARLGAGAVFGELAIFEGETRSATVQATEETIVVGLGAPEVMEVLRNDAEAALGMALALAGRLRATNERLMEHALATTPGRVAATLLSQVEARQAQGASARDVEVVGTAADIARVAGVDREGAQRVLYWLENEGALTLKRGRMIVHDPRALAKYLA